MVIPNLVKNLLNQIQNVVSEIVRSFLSGIQMINFLQHIIAFFSYAVFGAGGVAVLLVEEREFVDSFLLNFLLAGLLAL